MMAWNESRHREAGIDVIVRFHDAARLMELERAVFSLAGQFFRPLRILLVTQRFSAAEVEATLAALAGIVAVSEVGFQHVNLTWTHPEDARSDLVNLGFAAATGRYVALLDYDDVLYPDAHALLTARLAATGAGIAFARTPNMVADMYPAFLHGRSQANPYPGRWVGDLFFSNFCPPHSYAIDRTRVPENCLRFESMLTIEEDYEFLIRVCAAAIADFGLLDTEVGLRIIKTDGSNTYASAGPKTAEVLRCAAIAQGFVEARRQVTVIAPEVQHCLGMADYVPGLTVRQWLDTYRAAARTAEPAGGGGA